MLWAGESNHEKGREAAFFAKQWLESTTRCELPWDAYFTPNLVTIPDLGGKQDGYDLAGFLTANKCPLYVESKGVNHAGNQTAQYLQYLAHSYSATKRMFNEGVDKKWEFMWITTHPFLSSKWKEHCTAARIGEALEAHPEKLNGEEFDDDAAKVLSGRLWLVVLSERHSELMMSREHLGEIRKLVTTGVA